VRAALALIGALLALGAPGCALDPFGDETEPPLEDFGVRISAGIGAADPYLAGVSVEADSTVQFDAKIGDGNVIEFSMPRGPAQEIEVTGSAEGSDEALETVTLSSSTGAPIEVEGVYSIDPGFVGTEDNSTGDELVLRIAAPRLTGTGQGQVRLSFKTDVIAPGSAP
jgi:hypothetical protein